MNKQQKWTPERTERFKATMAAKRAAKDTRMGSGSVVPLDTLPVKIAAGKPQGKGRYADVGQPPIVVQFGKIKISIEVNS